MAGRFRFSPCNNCCCTIFEDNFNGYADESELEGKWNWITCDCEWPGTGGGSSYGAYLENGALVAAGAIPNVWLTCKTAFTNPVSFSAKLSIGTIGVNSIYLVFEYTDARNFKAFAIQQDFVRLISRVNGVETALDEAYGVSDPLWVRLCINGSIVNAYYGNTADSLTNSLVYIHNEDITPALALCSGIASGEPTSWDDILASRNSKDCLCMVPVECQSCSGGTMANSYLVEISGYTGSCSPLNGSWILSFDGVNDCLVMRSEVIPDFAWVVMAMWFTPGMTEGHSLYLLVGLPGGAGWWVYGWYDSETPLDCETLNELALETQDGDLSCGEVPTITVTAL